MAEHVAVVPEAATMLFTGGFPRSSTIEGREAIQRAIYYVQRNLEDLQTHLHSDKVIVCDRGTLDGAIYWPGAPHEFFAEVNSSLEGELLRYDTVVFFETAAMGGIEADGNPIRNESIQEAIALDKRLRSLWCQHPHFILIPHQVSFMGKLEMATEMLRTLVLSPTLLPKGISKK